MHNHKACSACRSCALWATPFAQPVRYDSPAVLPEKSRRKASLTGLREGANPCQQQAGASIGENVLVYKTVLKLTPLMRILEPVRNGTPAPLEARTDGAAVAGGDLLLTGRGFLTGWRKSDICLTCHSCEGRNPFLDLTFVIR